MEIDATCDTHLNFISVLTHELEVVWDKANKKYENINEPKFIGLVFRCLPEEIGRKTFRRYNKKDKYLVLDITISYEEYKKMYKIENRYNLGFTFYSYLEESLKKYNFKELNLEEFLVDIKRWCNEIGWLEEVDYSQDLEYPI